MKNLRFVVDQDIVLRVEIKKVDGSIPPSLEAVDITGWTGKWVLRDPSDDSIIFAVDGVIIGLATAGIMEFSVTGALNDTLLQLAASQLQFKLPASPSGAVDIVEDVLFTTKKILADS